MVVERSFAWPARLLRLAKGYERLAPTLMGMDLAVFAFIMLTRLASWPVSALLALNLTEAKGSVQAGPTTALCLTPSD